ncbi:hypothetical protein [Archangium primigenium]|uniref:hypothetical protein n=1 Tax=[Archangium] primigenium TaxID=2792470 RepID=UPI00195EDC7A|nr:hypothetical protein [Archangium primigenium]MBM7117609.1 hypothetical protein [Archangium primigenium]
MSCPLPKKPVVDVRTYTVYPDAHLHGAHGLELKQLRADAERLGDQVDATARELADAREALREAEQKLVRVEQERDTARAQLDAIRKEFLLRDMPAEDGPDALSSLRELLSAYRRQLLNLQQVGVERDTARADSALLLARVQRERGMLELLFHCGRAGHSGTRLKDALETVARFLASAPEVSTSSGAELLAAVRQVMEVVDRPTTPELQDGQLSELHGAVEGLRGALAPREQEVARG